MSLTTRTTVIGKRLGGTFGSGEATFGSGEATFGSGEATFGSGEATFGSGEATFGSGVGWIKGFTPSTLSSASMVAVTQVC
jgi:hypothetical protein